jgi:hypothetical protein
MVKRSPAMWAAATSIGSPPSRSDEQGDGVLRLRQGVLLALRLFGWE